jgi:polysaccharide pyruvyl transferase WcaK-like protein
VKLSLFGHFGTSNSGNESVLAAVLARLGAHAPEAEFSCVCSAPEAVADRYGIDAVSISRRVLKIRRRSVAAALPALKEELGEYVRAYKTLGGSDAFIVAGTGLVTDAYGLSSWGPYNLLKWSLMAKLRRCKVVFASVGVGPLDTVLGRFFVRAAFSLADYRSYRDGGSLRYVKEQGFYVEGDRVFPDLAFGLPAAMLPSSDDVSKGRRVVGLGLMEHAGKYSLAGPAAYARYLDALVEFAVWALAHDYDLRLFLGDGDTLVIDSFQTLLRERLDDYDEERVTCQLNTSVQATLAELAASDVVVATRFHNVLLSFLLEKPVIAISFHDKCDSLMREMGLSKYVHDINRMDAQRLIRQFLDLEANRQDLERHVSAQVEQYRSELDVQYILLLELVRAEGPSDTRRAADRRGTSARGGSLIPGDEGGAVTARRGWRSRP